MLEIFVNVMFYLYLAAAVLHCALLFLLGSGATRVQVLELVTTAAMFVYTAYVKINAFG